MQLSRIVLATGSLLLVLLGACTGTVSGRNAKNAAGAVESAGRATLELQYVQYDGVYLSGRLLVGVEEGRLTMDRRLIEHVGVQVESVMDCATSEGVAYMETDSFSKAAGDEEVLTLTPGYWYGADVRFFLFDEKLTGERAPECIDVTLALRAADRGVAARLRVRAERPAPAAPEVESGDG